MKILRIIALLALTVVSGFSQSASIPTTFAYAHGIPPRLQWEGNYGYCGEMSFISAGLHFGQYCSQYTARALASPGIRQSSGNSQLLIGVNDQATAKKMRLQASEFSSATQLNTAMFTNWVKNQTLLGHVVIIGLFNNGIRLGEWTQSYGGDSDYDHIVPVLGWGSDSSFQLYPGTALATDVITFSDNGLYGPFGNPPAYQFLYSVRMSTFAGTRQQANNPTGPVYMLKNRPPNYGIAIVGPLDLNGVTIPVSLSASKNQEPDIIDGSNAAPTPVALTLTAKVQIPNTSVAYNIYLYDDFNKVPVANFNASASAAKQSWKIPANSGTTYSVSIQTLTSATAVFRVVPQSAP